MRRREFIIILGGATTLGALPARAQQREHVPRVGIVWIAPQSVVRFTTHSARDCASWVISKTGRLLSKRRRSGWPRQAPC